MSGTNRNVPDAPGVDGALDWIADQFVERLRIDLRALAAFRIALGALLLTDLALRARNMTAFYTNDGAVPIALYETYYSSDFTIHTLSGEAWFQALLFVVAGVFAVSLLLGYRTRTVTVVSWLLLLSLHGRNSVVLNGGDSLLRMLLFWSIFLPLGERWSIDARRRATERASVATVATMALLAQVVIVYLVNGLHKLESDEWMGGEAAVTVMQLDQFSVLLGPIIADYPPILRLVTYVWVALVVLSPLLLLLTGLKRAAFATMFAGMHLGMALSMQIGLFPLISIAGLLPFYPPVVWDLLESRADRSAYARRVSDAVDRLAARLPNPQLTRALETTTGTNLPSARPLFSTILPWIFLTLVIMSNAQALDYADNPEPAAEALEYIEADQSWQMFAPNPLSTARWYVAPAELADGTQIDALNGGEVGWDRPPNSAEQFDSARWRKYMSNVRSLDDLDHPEYLGRYLCDRWNRNHDTEMTSVRIVVLQQSVEPYGERPEPRRTELATYQCGSGSLD